MPAASLTTQQRDEVIAKVDSGWSTQRCSEWLKRTYGVSLERSALHRLVQRHRSELADVSKGTARRKLAGEVESVVGSLQAHLAAAEQILTAAEELAKVDPELGVAVHAKAVASYKALFDSYQKAAGLDQPDNDPAVEGLAGLLGLALEEREAEEQRYIATHQDGASTDSA